MGLENGKVSSQLRKLAEERREMYVDLSGNDSLREFASLDRLCHLSSSPSSNCVASIFSLQMQFAKENQKQKLGNKPKNTKQAKREENLHARE